MDLFKDLKSVIKLREVNVDHEIFRLHYRLTSVMLLVSGILVASRQHFGDPIDCMSNDDLGKLLDTYCWIHSTFVVTNGCNMTIGVDGNPHPCIEKYVVNSGTEKRHQNYYQWVYFFLIFQAGLFYMPHFLWKVKEGKLLMKLASGMNNPTKKDDEKINTVVNYLDSHRKLHNTYFLTYAICEFLNFANVAFQVFWIDYFLGGSFYTYGVDVLRFVMMEQEDRYDPMIFIFPHMTKCTFHKYGASGDVQKHDSLCILPLNVLNEKIFVIMWFWFLFLGIISFLWCIYRIATFINPKLRVHILAQKSTLDCKKVSILVKNIDHGDWFLLSMLCKNMDAGSFHKIAEELLKRMPEAKDRFVWNRKGGKANETKGLLKSETPKSSDVRDSEVDRSSKQSKNKSSKEPETKIQMDN